MGTRLLALVLAALSLPVLGRSVARGARRAQAPGMIRVAGTGHMFVARGDDVGLCAAPDGVLVDGRFAELAPQIRAAIASLDEEGSGQPTFVLNTHHHDDHVDGNPVFGCAAPILAHENVGTHLCYPVRNGYLFLHPCFPYVDRATFAGLGAAAEGEDIDAMLAEGLLAPFEDHMDMLRPKAVPGRSFRWTTPIAAANAI